MSSTPGHFGKIYFSLPLFCSASLSLPLSFPLSLLVLPHLQRPQARKLAFGQREKRENRRLWTLQHHGAIRRRLSLRPITYSRSHRYRPRPRSLSFSLDISSSRSRSFSLFVTFSPSRALFPSSALSEGGRRVFAHFLRFAQLRRARNHPGPALRRARSRRVVLRRGALRHAGWTAAVRRR